MGLDMWLEDKSGNELKYWRKANAIHSYFINNCADNIDDCNSITVTRKDLEELVNKCKLVLEGSELIDSPVESGKTLKDGKWMPIIADGKTIKDIAAAEDTLPSQGGFFFGSTQYDQWYYDSIESTKDFLEDYLENNPSEEEFKYQASW